MCRVVPGGVADSGWRVAGFRDVECEEGVAGDPPFGSARVGKAASPA